MLLAAGANVKAATRVGAITPLFMACKNGNAAMIEALLKAGADANSTDEHGTTPLMMAAASGSADAVKVLIDHGADVNAREGAHGQTALMFAAALNRDAAIRVLLAHGADPRDRHQGGEARQILAAYLTMAARPVTEKEAAAPSRGRERRTRDQKAALEALAAATGFKSARLYAGRKARLKAI